MADMSSQSPSGSQQAVDTPERTYLDCPFHEKDEAKQLGARWDHDKRKWYVEALDPSRREVFSKWLHVSHTYLNVPFAEKDEAKELGARWDRDARRWYVRQGADLEPFSKWRTSDAAPARQPADATPSRAPAAKEWSTPAPSGSKPPVYTCPVHGVPLNGPFTVRKTGHNTGRQFFSCPQKDESCSLAGGWKWADGTDPFSAQSCRRFERHHGAPAGSVGVGVSAGGVTVVADELRDGVPVFDDDEGPRQQARAGPGDSSKASRKKVRRIDDDLEEAAWGWRRGFHRAEEGGGA